MKVNKYKALFNTFILSATVASAQAEESRLRIDWQKLNLTSEQSQKIQALEKQWNHDYMQIEPSIVDEQRKLTSLLADPASDSVEIMALQQTLARKKEQLRSAACANYLRKRQLLNQNQRHDLEEMINQAIAQRQKSLNPGSQTEVMPDHVQYLFQRVRNIWTQNGTPSAEGQ